MKLSSVFVFLGIFSSDFALSQSNDELKNIISIQAAKIRNISEELESLKNEFNSLKKNINSELNSHTHEKLVSKSNKSLSALLQTHGDKIVIYKGEKALWSSKSSFRLKSHSNGKCLRMNKDGTIGSNTCSGSPVFYFDKK